MVHPALLRTPTALAFAAGQAPASRSGRDLLAPAKRLLHRVNRWVDSGYRPELHYMRGGRTAGAKSLAAG
jgi:hypothetical protein